MSMFKRGCVVLLVIFLSACGSSNSTTSPTPTPLSLSLSLSPSGVGLANATLFTFTVTGGNTTTQYAWDFGDGTTTSGTASAVDHTYNQSGVFVVRVSATNPSGTVASASLGGITVKSVTGTWDM